LRIILVVNLRSGRGRAALHADAIERALRGRGHEPAIVGLANGADLRASLRESEAAVVIGGDGTLHAVIDDCIATGTPVYHAPAGTENLFAREFRMSARPDRVVDAVESGRRRLIDVGRAGRRAFVIMASIGWDAGVIHALSKVRGETISHLSYVAPMLSRLRCFEMPRMTIRADGRTLVQEETGLAIVANSRQYAMRIDPARGALTDDGLLDLAFFPYRNRLGLLRWVILAMAGAHTSDERFIQARASRVEVDADGSGADMQLDGEAVFPDPSDNGRVHQAFSVEARVLRVIVPRRD